jgi:hypothetical protein
VEKDVSGLQTKVESQVLTKTFTSPGTKAEYNVAGMSYIVVSSFVDEHIRSETANTVGIVDRLLGSGGFNRAFLTKVRRIMLFKGT